MNTKKETNNMQWLIDLAIDGKLDFVIQNSKQDFGVICMPTGTGKTGVCYTDILYHIMKKEDDGTKLLINISAPILKLTQQHINNLFQVLTNLYKDDSDFKDRFTFMVNSSDSGMSYAEYTRDLEVDVQKFSNIKHTIENLREDIIIVASCHKSLPKFVSAISKGKYNKKHNVISYIDECHLITNYSNVEEEDLTHVDMKKLCKFSTSVYGFSATPDADITRFINTYNDFNGSLDYIYKITPIEAIKNNWILPPHVSYVNSKDDRITPNMLKNVMKNAKYRNKGIHHKILVTLSSVDEIKYIRKELESRYGFKVFSTCSELGYNIVENQEQPYKDITEFIDAIEEYDGDCFVLHIKQLIQGIDIKGLTDCVIWSNSNPNAKTYRHIIQIIGRVLRCAAGERGLPMSERMKKEGGVYIISSSDDDKIQKNLSQFITRYYGIDNIVFDTLAGKARGAKEDDLFDDMEFMYFNDKNAETIITELVMNFRDIIESKIKWMHLNIANGRKMDTEKELKKIAERVNTDINMGLDTATLLYDLSDIFNIVKEIYNGKIN